jgi:hypothetical protein
MIAKFKLASSQPSPLYWSNQEGTVRNWQPNPVLGAVPAGVRLFVQEGPMVIDILYRPSYSLGVIKLAGREKVQVEPGYMVSMSSGQPRHSG